jgi:peptide/nickel transport system ATP-binding protein
VSEAPGHDPVLQLDSVRLSYDLPAGEATVVHGLNLTLRRGEALGLVGESGSGKSTIAYALVRYLGPHGRIAGGRILFEGRDLAAMSDAELRQIRGRRIAMVYQEAMSSLNPLMTVGRQLTEAPRIHEGLSVAAARARAEAMLAEVNFADPSAVMTRYPHQLSGGQQQRIVIAMALIGKPKLLIMDEPTTGLDVTVEAAVLELVGQLIRRHDTALMFISHNLGTVASLCDRLAVLYGGEIVEEGPIRQVFANPCHPYTRGLLDSLPRLGRNKHDKPLRPIEGHAPSPLARFAGCGFAPRCRHAETPRCTAAAVASIAVPGEADHRVRCVKAAELAPWRPLATAGASDTATPAAAALLRTEALAKQFAPAGRVFGRGGATVRALGGIDLAVNRGQTLAIVGESGCGKSTLARIVSGLDTASGGRVTLDGDEIAMLPVERRSASIKRKLQMVFQNPESTLNPRHSVGYAVARAVRCLKGLSPGEARREAERLLETVRLLPEIYGRKPAQLSGGQKQRVAIARALAGDPQLMVADEPVSSLDVSVQAAIINLLCELQADRDESLIFISHDLAVVRYLADHVAVMYLGMLVEFGPVDTVLAAPYHPYTEALLSAVPEPDPDRRRTRIILEGSLPSSSVKPKGCPFAARCPRKVGAVCDETPPPWQHGSSGHRIACHIALPDLMRLQAANPPTGAPSPSAGARGEGPVQ